MVCNFLEEEGEDDKKTPKIPDLGIFFFFLIVYSVTGGRDGGK